MTRRADFDILPLFIERQSQRAMSGASLPDGTLQRLFEAARWAPSASNSQPWCFVQAQKPSAVFDAFWATLAPGNQTWCQQASTLILLAARVQGDNGTPLPWAAFDAGAAWMSLALQASALQLVCHAMGGFDAARIATAAALPPTHKPLVMIAIGVPGDPATLPDSLRARETPTPRVPQTDFVHRDGFNKASS